MGNSEYTLILKQNKMIFKEKMIFNDFKGRKKGNF